MITLGLYLIAHRTQSSPVPEPWAFGLQEASAWGSSRSKRSTLPPNLPSLFNILYVGRQRPALPLPSTPHTKESPPAKTFLWLHYYCSTPGPGGILQTSFPVFLPLTPFPTATCGFYKCNPIN